MSYLSDFKEFDGGYVTFRGGANGSRITSKGTHKNGIRRGFSVARTSQQNGVAERRNRTLIENRVLVVKPYNKTPYELFRGRTPALSFMRPFGCHVTILHTLDHLAMFGGKADEGYFVRYSMNSKAFRATTKIKIVNGEEQIQALVDKKNVIITKTSVRSDLHLKDAEGTEYLPTATIFEQLTLMGAKTTA
nr:retrovirus-related Pol polyprotein from transposon TNT 1-94 [Tanacetum cinerariifolium]